MAFILRVIEESGWVITELIIYKIEIMELYQELIIE